MNPKVHQLTETTKSDFQANIIIAKFPIFLVAVILLFLCSMCTPTSADAVDNGSTIKITSPMNGSLVNVNEIVTGTAENISEGQYLWILVYPLTANKFYPQHGNVNIINGMWSLNVGLGDKENVNEIFKIIAVLADQESNEELTNYIATGNNTGWPGMGSIPDGAKVVDVVTVTRLNPEINFTYPSNATIVNMKETVSGTAKNIPSGYKLWILVHPLATNNLYPQKGNVQIINEKWSIPIEIGIKENAGEQFEIIAALADEKAHEEFTNYINTGKNTGYWPGMNNIPDGAGVYDEVIVTRNTEPMVNITSPLKTVKLTDTITGTAKYIPEGQEIWIVIYPQNANKYYPQNKVDIQSESDVLQNWVLQAQFGLENNVSEKFDIIAVLADQNAQNEFADYRDNSSDVQKLDGIQTLPNTTQEMARVTVAREGEEESSSSGGSSQSRSVGGGSPEPRENVESKDTTKVFIPNEKPVCFNFTNDVTVVESISFESNKTMGKTTAIVENLKNKSALVSDLPKDIIVYKYFNVWVGNEGYGYSDNIQNASICFKVNNTWIQATDINQSSIILKKYDKENKEWTECPVTIVDEDKDCMYFTANIPGFYSFAITGTAQKTGKERPQIPLETKTIDENISTDEKENNTKRPNPNSDTYNIAGIAGFVIVVGGIILIILCSCGFIKSKKKKENK